DQTGKGEQRKFAGQKAGNARPRSASCRINQIQRDPEQSWKWPEVHPGPAVDDHPFPTDRVAINVNIAAQEMLGLGIECIPESFVEENLAVTCRGNDPN